MNRKKKKKKWEGEEGQSYLDTFVKTKKENASSSTKTPIIPKNDP